MPVLTTSTTAPTSSYVTSIAHTQEQIHAAQRLRYQVFGEERGGRLDAAVDGRDVDEFDEVMDHLIVTDTATDTVVGTYRLLPPGAVSGSTRTPSSICTGFRPRSARPWSRPAAPVCTPTTARAPSST
ncbi:hypothetical protein SVIO_093050 [Streptomyces violaceusniger]|uniref:N-acetyltransferase domain-containing protein n=1 Tax=Streptomyces violaceusniger TaxID=68280 RepID=A0A4D4LBR0_STRVO|nr:hypothetical protein SVIO_093050 [Streptomyces violaceusniger]